MRGIQIVQADDQATYVHIIEDEKAGYRPRSRDAILDDENTFFFTFDPEVWEKAKKIKSYIEENCDLPPIPKIETSHQRKSIPTEVRREVWRRDEGHCVDCGSNVDLEFDHIIPVSKGGAHTARNIQLLCQKCNRAKSAKI